MAWIPVRVLSSQGAEGTAAPTADKFVSTLDDAQRPMDFVEVRFKGMSVLGAPSNFTYSVWRHVDGEVDCIARVLVSPTDYVTPVPNIYELHGDALAVQIDSFPDGTSPSVSATVQMRRVIL